MKRWVMIGLLALVAQDSWSQTDPGETAARVIAEREGREAGSRDGSDGFPGRPCSADARALRRGEAALDEPAFRVYDRSNRALFLSAFQIAYLRAFASARRACLAHADMESLKSSGRTSGKAADVPMGTGPSPRSEAAGAAE